MKHRLLYIPICFLFALSFVKCAKKGSPSGGPRDSIAPVIVKAEPENYSINFKEEKIEIDFDEFIKLKDLRENLIISPPFKNDPIITPISTSKTLKIEILDTLLENTTYTINFGKSIVDNNEENPFEYYKYVFSTGSYIDSLTLNGSVRDGLLPKVEKPTIVQLYKVDSTYTDSIIYKQKPTYLAIVKDSTSTFEFTNVKEGKYRLIALQEKSSDYIYQPSQDRLGFVDGFIDLPTDSVYTVSLFKEIPPFESSTPRHESKNHIIFGYKGNADSLRLDLISEVPSNFAASTFFDKTRDTLHYWFKPEIETDSLLFVARNKNYIDTLKVRMRELYADSLNVVFDGRKDFTPRDTITLRANIPIVSVDTSKIKITNRDSLEVAFQTRFNKKYNELKIGFNREESQRYQLEMLPGAISDFLGKENDTLTFAASTKSIADYGNITLTLNNVGQFPVIVQIVDDKYNVVVEDYLTENRDIYFDYLSPAKYYLRIVYDENENGQWDTGSILENQQPEEVLYYPTQIEVRANWSLNETFTLTGRNRGPSKTEVSPED